MSGAIGTRVVLLVPSRFDRCCLRQACGVYELRHDVPAPSKLSNRDAQATCSCPAPLLFKIPRACIVAV